MRFSFRLDSLSQAFCVIFFNRLKACETHVVSYISGQSSYSLLCCFGIISQFTAHAIISKLHNAEQRTQNVCKPSTKQKTITNRRLGTGYTHLNQTDRHISQSQQKSSNSLSMPSQSGSRQRKVLQLLQCYHYCSDQCLKFDIKLG